MRSLSVKTVCDNSGNLPRTTLTAPDSPLGDFRDAALQVRKINNIPDTVSDVQAIHLFQTTTNITWLGGGKPGRLEFDFSELGEGKIIRA